jgi:nucleotide-binding universal stress UspA family protein
MSSTQVGDGARKIVLVVGVDLSEVSEHLIATARDVVHSAPQAELHLVHVVPPEPLTMWLETPLHARGFEERARVESARFTIGRLCASVSGNANVRCHVHTPVGDPAVELTRIARQVGADVVVLEAHAPRSGLSRFVHRSAVMRIVQSAPCSVLLIRSRAPAAAHANGRRDVHDARES